MADPQSTRLFRCPSCDALYQVLSRGRSVRFKRPIASLAVITRLVELGYLRPAAHHRAGAISMLAQLGMFFGRRRDNNSGLGIVSSLLMLVLAPLAAMIVQMAISRTREYAADNLGARISGRPDALASALVKISSVAETVPNDTAESHPATAPLFIVNPLSGHGMDNLFSTHPSTENRVAALDRLSREMGLGGGAPATSGASDPWNNSRGGPWESAEGPRGPWG
jgi:heat shock protein HtpX